MSEEAITIHSVDEINEQVAKIREAASRAHRWVAEQIGEPIDFLRRVKFGKSGFHPVTHEPLNFIEQINQTWTYLVALEATRHLLGRHPEAGGFKLAPGASFCQELDIMSTNTGLVGAEIFAATSPKSNEKLKKDLAKLATRVEIHRYVFFACPTHPSFAEVSSESGGVKVFSIVV